MQKLEGSSQSVGEGVHGCKGKRVRYVVDYCHIHPNPYPPPPVFSIIISSIPLFASRPLPRSCVFFCVGSSYIVFILFRVYFLVLLLDPSFLPLTLSFYSHYSAYPHSATIPSHMILPFPIWPSYLCTCSSIPESDLQSRLVVYNLLYFTYAPQFIYQLSLPSSCLKFPFVFSVSSHYLLSLCHSEIKDTTLARARHISLCQVLTKSPPPLSSIGFSGPICTNLPSTLWNSVGLEPGGSRLDNYSYSVRANLFAELPTIFIPHWPEESTFTIKLHPQKAELQLKVILEPKNVKDDEDIIEEDEETPHKRPKTTHMNCRSSGSFIMSNEMKQMILTLEGKMLMAHGYLKELQGCTSTIETFITSQQADLEDLKVVMGIWGNAKEAMLPRCT